MRTKLVITLSALLLAPLMSQAEWIETTYWPYIYRYDGNTWEYAYTNCFWTWSYSTGEYSLWGQEVSALAPESIEFFDGRGIHFFLLNLYLYGQGGDPSEGGEIPILIFDRDGFMCRVLRANYQRKSPDEAVIHVILREYTNGPDGLHDAPLSLFLELKFTTPTEGKATYTILWEDEQRSDGGVSQRTDDFIISESYTY